MVKWDQDIFYLERKHQSNNVIKELIFYNKHIHTNNDILSEMR